MVAIRIGTGTPYLRSDFPVALLEDGADVSGLFGSGRTAGNKCQKHESGEGTDTHYKNLSFPRDY